MFEEYLQDAYYFRSIANVEKNDKIKKRYFRVTIFCLFCAIESYINYIIPSLEESKTLTPYEISFLYEKKYELIDGKFEIGTNWKYHRCEDKLKFLLVKFDKTFDFKTNPCWPRFQQLKKKRDELTHPRTDDDNSSLKEYDTITLNGINSLIEIIDRLSYNIFKAHLRKQIHDLKIVCI